MVAPLYSVLCRIAGKMYRLAGEIQTREEGSMVEDLGD